MSVHLTLAKTELLAKILPMVIDVNVLKITKEIIVKQVGNE